MQLTMADLMPVQPAFGMADATPPVTSPAPYPVPASEKRKALTIAGAAVGAFFGAAMANAVTKRTLLSHPDILLHPQVISDSAMSLVWLTGVFGGGAAAGWLANNVGGRLGL